MGFAPTRLDDGFCTKRQDRGHTRVLAARRSLKLRCSASHHMPRSIPAEHERTVKLWRHDLNSVTHSRARSASDPLRRTDTFTYGGAF